MKEVKKHIQNWKDIHIAVIPKLSEIDSESIWYGENKLVR